MADDDPPFPDGIAERHAQRRRLMHRHGNVVSLIVLGGLMALALSGALGGGKADTVSVAMDAGTLAVWMPRTLRNGEFYEMRIAVVPARDVADLQIAVSPALWHEMTVNTMIPAATDETMTDGTYRFGFGARRKGERLEMKVDGQINPPLTFGTRGTVAVYDGDVRLAEVPVAVRVLP